MQTGNVGWKTVGGFCLCWKCNNVFSPAQLLQLTSTKHMRHDSISRSNLLVCFWRPRLLGWKSFSLWAKIPTSTRLGVMFIGRIGLFSLNISTSQWPTSINPKRSLTSHQPVLSWWSALIATPVAHQRVELQTHSSRPLKPQEMSVKTCIPRFKLMLANPSRCELALSLLILTGR